MLGGALLVADCTGVPILSPSSYGLQPWRFLVVDDPDLPAQCGTRPAIRRRFADAAKLVVCAARKGFGPSDINRHVERIAEVRRVPLSSLVRLRHKMAGLPTRPAVAV